MWILPYANVLVMDFGTSDCREDSDLSSSISTSARGCECKKKPMILLYQRNINTLELIITIVSSNICMSMKDNYFVLICFAPVPSFPLQHHDIPFPLIFGLLPSAVRHIGVGQFLAQSLQHLSTSTMSPNRPEKII